MFGLFAFAVAGYIFFKYMWPLLRSDVFSENRPDEVYRYYDNHPKLFVLTIMFAVFGISQVLAEISSILVGFIFMHCFEDMGGTLGVMCAIKEELGFLRQ